MADDIDFGFKYMPFWAQSIFMALFVLLFDNLFHLGIVRFISGIIAVTGLILILLMAIGFVVLMFIFKQLGLLTSTGTGLRTSYRFKR